MQDVTGLALEPAHLAALPPARNNAEAGGDIPVEGQHPELVLAQHVHVVEERQVVQDGIVGGEADVVRQARAGQVDRNLVQQPALGIRHAVGHEGRLVAIIEEQQLTGAPVHLGVG